MKKISLYVLLVILGFLTGFLVQEAKFGEYRQLDNVINEMSAYKYDWDKFDCKNFADIFSSKLSGIGIKSTQIVIKQRPEYDHAVVGIWFDPQTREFVKDGEYIRNLK